MLHGRAEISQDTELTHDDGRGGLAMEGCHLAVLHVEDEDVAAGRVHFLSGRRASGPVCVPLRVPKAWEGGIKLRVFWLGAACPHLWIERPPNQSWL
ncbi:hypothetical protein AGR6A_pAt20070 [Agrobacterium sp. NCPPB 925]|nr:hypothetical protein AGR6A_pAt20070 [Agrobacterium sp. NCPPB 925]